MGTKPKLINGLIYGTRLKTGLGSQNLPNKNQTQTGFLVFQNENQDFWKKQTRTEELIGG